MPLSRISNNVISDNTITNAKINSSAAIAKTKLASLDIVNADVNASAAIAGTKLGTMATANMPNGTVLQFASAQSVSNISTASTSAVAVSALTVTITPTESGNKIIYNLHGGHISYLTGAVRLYMWLYLKIGSGAASNASPAGGTNRWLECETSSTFGIPHSLQFVYTATGTDALEFTPYIASSNGSLTTFFNAAPYVMTASCTEIRA
tara:strand:+ start:46 stop:669 length:624 start_codon:yes stop_codon:yes gene_type:complete